jgi:hypothetical protein
MVFQRTEMVDDSETGDLWKKVEAAEIGEEVVLEIWV